MTTTSGVNPTVARRELAVYFHRLREQRGRSLGDLGALLGVAQSQASRLDTGARGLRAGDVAQLCRWYGLGAGETARLLALADDARKRAWWQQVDIRDDSYRTLIGFEQAAESIREFCNTVVPGLLQTERYARAVAANAGGDVQPKVLETAVNVRMRRQAILHRASPPALSVVVDEAVLARGPGSIDVLREQLDHLLEFGDRPRTAIQVIGFEAGMYPVPDSQFILLDLGLRLPPVYYREDLLSAFDSSDDAELGKAEQLWRLLQAKALDPVRSAKRIAAYRDRLVP